MTQALTNWANLRLWLIGLAAFLLAASAALSAELPLTPIESGVHSNVSARSFRVVVDQDAFRELHRRIHSHRLPSPSAPLVDFSRVAVVAAFMGWRPSLGYRIGFGEAVVVEGGRASVRVVEREPPPGTVRGQVITTPYALAILACAECDEIDFVAPDGDLIERVAPLKPGRRSHSVSAP